MDQMIKKNDDMTNKGVRILFIAPTLERALSLLNSERALSLTAAAVAAAAGGGLLLFAFSRAFCAQ